MSEPSVEAMTFYARGKAQQQANAARFEQARSRIGLWYGMGAGLVFSLVTWGWDALQLAGAHAAIPWGKLLLGLPLCLLLGGLAGWLSMKVGNTLLSVLLWGINGFLFAGLAAVLPLQGYRLLLGLSDPALQPFAATSLNSGLEARWLLTAAASVVAFALAGLFMTFIVESTASARDALENWKPMLLWAALFLAAGYMGDSLINEPLRLPLMAMDRIIEFKVSHRGEEIDPAQARAMHLSALSGVDAFVERPRRLLLNQFDDTLVMVHVLVDFGGIPVRCTVYNQQPGFCEPFEAP